MCCKICYNFLLEKIHTKISGLSQGTKDVYLSCLSKQCGIPVSCDGILCKQQFWGCCPGYRSMSRTGNLWNNNLIQSLWQCWTLHLSSASAQGHMSHLLSHKRVIHKISFVYNWILPFICQLMVGKNVSSYPTISQPKQLKLAAFIDITKRWPRDCQTVNTTMGFFEKGCQQSN